MTIRLIVGLGNPGAEYEHSRHNAGVDLLRRLADKYNISLRDDPKYFGETGRGTVEGQEVRLLFPTTFMNLSGKAVGALAGFFKINPDEILVIHDELDINPGLAKIKLGGGPGGHNGLKSIIASLGNNQGFYRLRLGIGHPANKAEMVNFVLGRPAPTERALIEQAADEALVAIKNIFTQNIDRATNKLNAFKPQATK